MRVHDWAATSLGAPALWPQPLQTVISLMLHTKTPAAVAWGPALCLLYNDAYRDILGERHPAALGCAMPEVWPEVWGDIAPLIKQALAGEPVYIENEPYTVCRNGWDETVWFSFSFIPVHGSDGQIDGLYCPIIETTAQVLAEKHRYEQIHQLYSLFEEAPSFMAIVREPGHIYEMTNSAFQRLTGEHDLIGRRISDLPLHIPGQDCIGLLDQVCATGKPFIGNRIPITVQSQPDKPPVLHFLDFIFQPIIAPDGMVSGVFIEGNDVTAHVRIENELRQSRLSALESAQRLDALLEAAPVGIIVADVNGKLLRVNPANRQICGNHPLPEKVEEYGDWKGWWADGSARHGRPLAPQEWALARVLQGEEAPRDTVEIEVFGKPGQRRTILNCGAPVRDASGNITGAVVAQMDITDRVLSESALRDSEAMFRTITNAMPQLVWSTLPNGHHDYHNQQWYDYTGISSDCQDSDAWNELIHPQERARVLGHWRHCMETGEPYEMECRLRHCSGQYRWNLARALPVRDSQGTISRWMGTCTDLHEQKMAQEMLRESDQRKDEFLAMLAHELRNPLAPIITAADLLFMGQPDEKRVRQLSEVISRQSGHMTRLIDDLLDVSRVTRGLVTLNRQPMDINSLLSEAIEQVRPLLEAKAHYLQVQHLPQRVLVAADKMRLVQVLANVLNNAIKYTPDGGQIELRLETDGGQVILSVRDNGMGMSAELVESAFELFSQGQRSADRAQGGLGIGLALVKSLVQLHGGTVTVRSEGAGRGSEFRIFLPRLPDEQGPRRPAAGQSGAGPANAALRILVVDDNVDAAQLMGMLLEMLGHQVTVEYSSAKALESAARLMPQICLLDIGLPDMDGYELARQLRQIPGMEDAILAAVTGYGQPQDRKAAFTVGFNCHFAKPVDTKTLQEWLTSMAAQVVRKS
ncbi:MAG: PAS domain S-box protein [Polaromonas sp.]|nr:PAS domain S-box protein [Polaromonas sp.]